MMASGLWEEMSLGWTIKCKHDKIGFVLFSFFLAPDASLLFTFVGRWIMHVLCADPLA